MTIFTPSQITEPEVVSPNGKAPPGERAEAPPPLVPPEMLRASRGRQVAVGVGYGILGFVLLGLAWQFASTRAEGLPGPMKTIDTLVDQLANGFATDGPDGQGILLQLRDSVVRVFKGFGLATLVGIPFGLAIGRSRRMHLIFNPVVQLARPISPLAWFPIALTVLVTSDPATVWVIFMAAVWPVVLNSAAGAASVPSYQQDVARVFQFNKSTQLRQIVIPHALPSILTGLRLSMGVAWMVIVAAEMLSASSGIGFYVWQSYNGDGLTKVLSAVLLIGAVGVALDFALQGLGRLITHEESHS
jgi:nitrate/nitrite transport system permease protein